MLLFIAENFEKVFTFCSSIFGVFSNVFVLLGINFITYNS